jgi:type II secretory pathway component PulK
MVRGRALALLVVVYILAALGTLAFALAFRSRIGLCQTRLSVDRMQQDQIALAACARACRLLATDDPNVDSCDDAWWGWHELIGWQETAGRGSSEQVWWRLADESAKINVNLASPGMLTRIEGLDQAAVASIRDWIDEDDVPNPDGAETEYYTSRPGGGACRNGPLESLEELALVKGINAETYFGVHPTRPSEDLEDLALEQIRSTEGQENRAGLCELLTVYGDGRINLNTALPAVLKALPFLSETAIGEILARQQPRARKFTGMEDIRVSTVFTATDKIVLLQAAKCSSNHFRLDVKMQLDDMPSTCEYAAILRRDPTGVHVLSWQRMLPRGEGDPQESGAEDRTGRP